MLGPGRQLDRPLTRLCAALVAIAGMLLFSATDTASAQYEDLPRRYYPLNHGMPPGKVARWSGVLGNARPGYFQPVRITLPSTGKVTVFGRQAETASVPAPAGVGFMVGHTYRVRISGMPEFPGIELYPTIEVIDSLHAPPGTSEDFPIPVALTEEDIEQVLHDRMVTKVVYLEQPQMVSPFDLRSDMPVRQFSPTVNLLAEADRYGRPLAIVRLGGRIPDPQGDNAAFFGRGAPFVMLRDDEEAPGGNQPRSSRDEAVESAGATVNAKPHTSEYTLSSN